MCSSTLLAHAQSMLSTVSRVIRRRASAAAGAVVECIDTGDASTLRLSSERVGVVGLCDLLSARRLSEGGSCKTKRLSSIYKRHSLSVLTIPKDIPAARAAHAAYIFTVMCFMVGQHFAQTTVGTPGWTFNARAITRRERGHYRTPIGTTRVQRHAAPSSLGPVQAGRTQRRPMPRPRVGKGVKLI